MTHSNFEHLVTIVNKLRDPDTGCPWDLKQTHLSLLKYLIEESYEYIHAVESGSTKKMEEELGDVLLQILLHTKIAEEQKNFSLESISKVLSEKLIRRHPHVFEKKESIEAEQVVKNWNKIKEKEQNDNKTEKHRIDPGYLSFPALFSANKIGEKTNKIKFDWKNHTEVVGVVESEWTELKTELESKSINKERVEEELGDLLFSIAQLSRHLDIGPENALRMANKKFD